MEYKAAVKNKNLLAMAWKEVHDVQLKEKGDEKGVNNSLSFSF